MKAQEGRLVQRQSAAEGVRFGRPQIHLSCQAHPRPDFIGHMLGHLDIQRSARNPAWAHYSLSNDQMNRSKNEIRLSPSLPSSRGRRQSAN